jgi:aminoglycoside phosphotransferase
MNLIHAENWFDFGNLESLINSKKSLLRPRHFNQLIIDPLLNTITKISEKNEKLEDELNWYSLLPEELKILTPRIISRNKNATQVTITQEFYGYPTLSELFVYGDLSIPVWESIIQYLFEIHKLFSIYTKSVSVENSKIMYIDKTQERINQLLQDDTWKEIWNYETININGKTFPNIPTILKKLDPSIVNLTQIETYSIIHGDYCLSNLLYDLNNQIVRMIDPRGSFGQKGIYGDPRYDIAKLRHSVAGLYDYMVADLFTVSFEGNNFTFEILEDEKNIELEKYMDACILKYGYHINEIKLIEALLFLSMIPYHADYPARQQIMYITAHQKLFNLYEM